MKISYNWLKEFVEFNKTPEQLADDLSLFGHEVESVEKVVYPERSRGDYVLDFEITPNRGDCLSILGMAREIAALYNVNLKIQTSNLKIKEDALNKNININIEKSEICPRFTARIIDNIKIEPSPKWMQEKLATYGFRPINNIVDTTNYVMVATGQPLHAFDYDKIKDGFVNIRQAKRGEEVITLDGQNRYLDDGTIIIEDQEKIYDLAGIMGGLKSEVDEKTKTVILQGAIFDPILIRQSSKYLNHITDASYRYERSVNFNGTIYGVNYATSIIMQLLPNVKTGKLLDQINLKQVTNQIPFDDKNINKLIGTNISKTSMIGYLKRLGFLFNNELVLVPSYRTFDVKIWQDLAEEIARLYGFNNITKNYFNKLSSKENNEFIVRESIKDYLSDNDFIEIYSYSFTDIKLLKLLNNNKDIVQIQNPLSPETEYLRSTLIASVLNQIAKNPWAPEINIYEIEKVFTIKKEFWQICIATVGKNEFRLNKLLKDLKINSKIFRINQNVLDYLKIRRPVKYIISNIVDINFQGSKYYNIISNNKYIPISKYPPTVRDLSFIVKNDINKDEFIKLIKLSSDKIFLTELFDVYKMDKNYISLAFHIWIQNMNGPVTDKDSSFIIQNIIDKASKIFNAKLRSRK